MENRYKIPFQLQKKYFKNLEKISNLNAEQLAEIFGVTGRTYRDWRRGKFTIPQKIVNKSELLFNITFPYKKELAENSWKKAKRMASQKGGLVRFSKYGQLATPEGRAKGGHKTLEILRARGVIPIVKPFFAPKEYSKDLAEFMGILLGDGHLSSQQWSITINSIADKDYLPYVKKLTKKLFKFDPRVFKKKDCNAYVIYGGGKESIRFFQKQGLSIGNKIKLQVDVPEWIKKNINFRIACLRGLIDTDGGIFIHKYKVNNKIYSYTKLSFVNRSIPLIDFVYTTLNMLELHAKQALQHESKRVWLYNHNDVKNYLKIVGTHNPRLEKNILILYGGVR